MSLWDLVGYVAAALVLAAFCMREMVPLRVAALCSNLAFIAYGLALGLAPVWLLHALLLPMNGYRLLELLRARRISASRKIEVVRLGPANGSAAGSSEGGTPWRTIAVARDNIHGGKHGRVRSDR